MFESQYAINNGKITPENFENLKRYIYKNGIQNDAVRREVYPYILKYRSLDSDYETYLETKKQLKTEYNTMKRQWMTISEKQEERWQELALVLKFWYLWHL